jgi:hypothetical protein
LPGLKARSPVCPKIPATRPTSIFENLDGGVARRDLPLPEVIVRRAVVVSTRLR